MNTVLLFILINLVIFFISIFTAFKIVNYYRKKKGEKLRSLSEFLDLTDLPSYSSILVGLSFGFIFGLLDNLGLWFGINTLEKYMPGGLLTKAALGNTYSDFLGVIVGTSISVIGKASIGYDNNDEPIWVNAIGILVGCLMGMVLGRLITGKK